MPPPPIGKSNEKNPRLPDKLCGLEITLGIGCKYNCYYCPQKNLLEAYQKLPASDIKLLTFDNFSKALEKVAKQTCIAFAGFSEPFGNRECARMIRYAYDNGYKVMLATTLELMTDDDYQLVKDIEFEDVYIHLPDVEMKSHFNYDENYVKKLEKVCRTMRITDFSCHGKPDQKLMNVLPESVPLVTRMGNRAGNLKYEEFKETPRVKGEIACLGTSATGKITHISHMLLPNGYLTTCCNDYSLKHIFGNIFEQDIDDIFNGEEYKFYINGFRNESADILCRTCGGARPCSNIKTNEYNLWCFNAIRMGYCFLEIERDIKTNSFDGNKYGIKPHKALLVKRILEAENICVFGLGKLFTDNYYGSGWNKVICANLCLDNNLGKANEIEFQDGIKFVSLENLKNYNNLLIITYVRGFESLHRQLADMGFYNIINIYDIYDLFD
jgi:hypothetical protein